MALEAAQAQARSLPHPAEDEPRDTALVSALAIPNSETVALTTSEDSASCSAKGH